MPQQLLDTPTFLARITDATYRRILEDFLEHCQRLGLHLKWGVGGASIRIATPDRAEPLSVAWLFLPQARGWYGLKDLTLGFDSWSTEATPSVMQALEQYVEEAATLPGAEVVSTKSLRAYHFSPTATVRCYVPMMKTIATMVQQISEAATALPAPDEQRNATKKPSMTAEGKAMEDEQALGNERTQGMSLEALRVLRKLGTEEFHATGRMLGFDLLQFWRWYSSDLVSNTMRGVLAEYLVASDLGIADGMRTEWDAFDLKTQRGIKVEVKSAAYLQSWHQTKPSSISFGIQPTMGWDASTNESSTERRRQADVYVFAVLKHRDKPTLDPLNVDQWDFYVVPTRVLDETLGNQKTLSLARLHTLNPLKTGFGEIAGASDAAIGSVSDPG